MHLESLLFEFQRFALTYNIQINIPIYTERTFTNAQYTIITNLDSNLHTNLNKLDYGIDYEL